MPGNLKWRVFLVLLFLNVVTKADIFGGQGFILSDLRDRVEFSPVSKLSLCSVTEYQMPVVIANDETGIVYREISLRLSMPAGIVLGESKTAKVWMIDRDAVNANPSVPYLQFASDVSAVTSWDLSQGLSNPRLTIQKELPKGKLFLVQIGVQATCGIDVSSTLLQYAYSLSYSKYSTEGILLNSGLSYTLQGNSPLNNAITTPVILVSPQASPEQVTGRQVFKRKVVLQQTGQLAELDSLFYSDLVAVPVEMDTTSVQVNGKPVLSVQKIPGNRGIQFPLPAALFDNDSIYKEGDSIIVTYLITATCQPGEVQSEIKASWGCRGSAVSCYISSGYYAFNVISNGYPDLSSKEVTTPYDCSTGTGNYAYTISNTGIFKPGFAAEAAARDINLKFDDRSCELVNYDKFELSYKGVTKIITPIQQTGSIRLFDIQAVINGLLPADGDSFFVFSAFYRSKCRGSNDPSCYLNCNVSCRKPYIEVLFNDQCSKRSQKVFHRDNGGTDPLALPCVRPQISFTNYTAPGLCKPGKFIYKADLSATGVVQNVRIAFGNNNCTFYTVTRAFVNNVSYPVVSVNGGWEILVPGTLSGSDNQIVFEISGNEEAGLCAYPDISFKDFSFCGSANNSFKFAYSGQGSVARISNGQQPLKIELQLKKEIPIDYCLPGYLEYQASISAQDTISDISFELFTGGCRVYEIDSIAVNGKILPSVRWTNTGDKLNVDLKNFQTALLSDLDRDGFKDDMNSSQNITIRFYTSIGTANASPCAYPGLTAKYSVCSSASQSTTLTNSGMPVTTLIKSPTGYPQAGIQVISDPQTDWVSYCKEGKFQYKVNLNAVNTIYDLRLQLDTRGCEMYNISGISLNGLSVPLSSIRNTGGVITLDFSNSNLNTGLVDADGDGFKDDAVGQPVIVTFFTQLNEYSEINKTCCRQPELSVSYILCGNFRDSISSIQDNSSYCLQPDRPQSKITFKGYERGSYCSESTLQYTVKRNTVSRMESIQLILEQNGCNKYTIDGIRINNRQFPALPAYQQGGRFTFNLDNIQVPINGFSDGSDMDGKTDAFDSDSFDVDFIISPLNSSISCSYPTFRIEYGICGSMQVEDVLQNSGKNAWELLSDEVSSMFTTKLVRYNPPSYCDTGSINYAVTFSRKDTIGGVKIFLDTRGNDFYQVDEFRVNGTQLPLQYISRQGGNYLVDMSGNLSQVNGFSDMTDADNFSDETDTTFTITAIISLPCVAGDNNGENVPGIDGTCRGPSKSAFWPSLVISYDKCFNDKRFSDTLKSSGYLPGVLLMKDDNGLSEGGISKYTTNADPSAGGIRHDIYYKYSYVGIAPCPNDTQLVFRIEFPDHHNGRDTIDGFVLNYSDAPVSLMRHVNTGYMGHKSDTLYLSNGEIDKVLLSIYFDQSAALALGPSSTPLERKISFFSTGYLGSKPCDFEEFVPSKQLVNASLSFLGRDDLGITHCRYERWCKDTLRVAPLRDIPPCPCPAEWAVQSLVRSSRGYKDASLTERAVLPDLLSRGGTCDTFLLTNVLVKRSSSSFDTMYIRYNPSGDEVLTDYHALKWSSLESLVIKDEQGIIKTHNYQFVAEPINGQEYVLKIFQTPGSPGAFLENDSLIISTVWITDLSQMAPGIISSQQMLTRFSYDREYAQNSEICLAGAVRSPYTVVHYNTDSVKIVNEYEFADCHYDMRSSLVNSVNIISRPDYWPNEYRPMYYADSIVVKVKGSLLDIRPGAVSISSIGENFVVPDNEIRVSRDSSSTTIVLYNYSGNWPAREYANLKGDTIYTVSIQADFYSCCYQVTGTDSSFSFTYYYHAKPGDCYPKIKTGTTNIAYKYTPNLVAEAVTRNTADCSFEFLGSIFNKYRGEPVQGYPVDYAPVYRPDSISFTVEALVDIKGPVSISNNSGQSYQLSDLSHETLVRKDIQHNRTYITLFNAGNWPLMVDSPANPDSLLTVSTSFSFAGCCYTFNQEIDILPYAVYWSNIQGDCNETIVRDTAEVISVKNDNAFYSASHINMLPGCKFRINTDLYSYCDPAENNCYPSFIRPEYKIDSVTLVIKNNHLSEFDSIYLGMPGLPGFLLDPLQVKRNYISNNTYLTLLNTGNWPVMMDTMRGDVPAYSVQLISGFGGCCYAFEDNSSIVAQFHYTSTSGSCKYYLIGDSLPLYSAATEINYTASDHFDFKPSCSSEYNIAIKRDCDGTCTDSQVFSEMAWKADTITIQINGSGIAPGKDITITTADSSIYSIPYADIKFTETNGTTTISLIDRSNNWPAFFAGSSAEDTLFTLRIPFSFTSCCYAFTSEGAKAIFDYNISLTDEINGGCQIKQLSGSSVVHSSRNSGEILMNSSMDASVACSARLQGKINYSCPSGNCYDPGNMPEYRIDSIWVEVAGALHTSGNFDFNNSGSTIISLPLSGQRNFIDNGKQINTFSFSAPAATLSFKAINQYDFILPVAFDACLAIQQDISYRCTVFYNTTDETCKAGVLVDYGILNIESYPNVTLTPLSGFRQQRAANGHAEWVFDLEKTDVTAMLWTAVIPGTNAVDDFRIFHIYDKVTGADSLLPMQVLAGPVYMAGVSAGSKERFRIEAALGNCEEQQVNIYAGTACSAMPSSLSEITSSSALCSTVSLANNRVVVDSSGIQAAFIVDPTVSGIKACDTLDFLLEVKNVKRGNTYDHTFKYAIPDNYSVDEGEWGFIYPFDKLTQVDHETGMISANVQRFPAKFIGVSGHSREYQFSLGDLSSELSTHGIPGFDPAADSIASIAIVCRVFTSCDFSSPDIIRAEVQASTVCKSERINANTNTAKPILHGVDLTRLNDYALVFTSPADSAAQCGDTILVMGSIIHTNAGVVLNGEVLHISLPQGIILTPPVSNDQGWDWADAIFSSNPTGSTWSIALPAGAWPEKQFSFTAILADTYSKGTYDIQYNINYEDEISCSSQQAPCQININEGAWRNTLQFRNCETPSCVIDLLDDTVKFCSGYVQIYVLNNDSLACGNLQAEVSRPPYNGAVIKEGNSFIYIPDPDFTIGTDTFYYRICSAVQPDICDEAKVVVIAGNCLDPKPPVANDDSLEISIGRSALISILSNDFDPDGNEIWVCRGIESILVRPSFGSVNIIGDSIATYVPQPDFSGTDQFSYEICDADGLRDTAMVTIVVHEGNHCDMPNGFSPNGDGINDLLVVPCISSGPKQLHVWNRWGNELFFSENYKDTWDGTYKGGQLPAGNYFYSLIYEDMTGNEIRMAGYLAIYQ